MNQIITLFELQSKKYASDIALSFHGQNFSFDQINRKVNQFACFLINEGVQVEDRIGIAIDRTPEMLIVMLGILKAGAAYVPLDPEYPQKRIEYMLTDSAAKLLIVSAKYKGLYKSGARELAVEDTWPKLSDYPAENIDLKAGPDNLAYVLYTSGSTGLPKGVQIEHHNLYNLLLSVQKFPGLNHKDKLLAVTTISFDISITELFLPLITGARLVLTDSQTTKDGGALLDIIRNERITFIQATPVTYKIMLEAGWDEQLDLKVTSTGEPLPKDLALKLLPKCTALFNMYGPTETTIFSTGKQIKTGDEQITIGKPVDNTAIYILDDNLQQVAEGETGEIYIAGEGVARGYFNKPELTAERFLDDPFATETGTRMYRTGDLGKVLPDGDIFCFGRIDNQVKIRGYRIELSEIEFILSQQKNIKEAVVLSLKNRAGDPRLVAYVVPLAVKEITKATEIQNWKAALKASLPIFMVPNDFVLLDALPLTANGKIDRSALPNPEINIDTTLSSYLAPRTKLEKLIADIWTTCLKIENIGLHDNFFELGGHSLAAVQVITRIKNETGKRIRLANFFEYPTVEQLAILIENNKKQILNSLVPIKPEGTKVPLYIVHGNGSTAFKFISFAQQMDAEQPVFGLQAIGIDGFIEPLDNIKDIAASYISEIIAHNPNGPYCLSGYSFGGVMAFEMAQQLMAMGKTVTLLAMFEGYVINNYQLKPGIYKTLHRVYTRARKFMFGFYLLAAEPKRTIEYKLETLKIRINQMAGKNLMKENKPDADLEFIDKVAKVHQKAVANYQLRPYNGDIHVFRAEKRSFYIDDFVNLGWVPYARSVKIHDIDGEHMIIFDAPQNKKFARSLQVVMDECNKGYTYQPKT
ncbi:amino acid adenylation domain-containing protein [Mucilaginibacter sp. HMF5004]|uniref:non-ribosomal peptide synthetase n=1 Tax=Mucilaginibacter rivuli TaxID=2857527 RepID=UPI001C5FC117|nr:amino acid adenylation domain-containing protein [Mucilaginibacter rivuli]MBW4891780.1 amino acid adenylation domain-containing protein [Mucilaginibacter rivuli]